MQTGTSSTFVADGVRDARGYQAGCPFWFRTGAAAAASTTQGAELALRGPGGAAYERVVLLSVSLRDGRGDVCFCRCAATRLASATPTHSSSSLSHRSPATHQMHSLPHPLTPRKLGPSSSSCSGSSGGSRSCRGDGPEAEGAEAAATAAEAEAVLLPDMAAAAAKTGRVLHGDSGLRACVSSDRTRLASVRVTLAPMSAHDEAAAAAGEDARLAVAELHVELSVRFLQQWFSHHVLQLI
jgi:hypothetical protein